MDDTNDPNIDESSERRENNVASENEHQIFSPNETGLTHQDETVIEKKQEEKPDQNVPQNHTSIELKVETETEIEIQFEENNETKPIELKVELETESNPIELEIEREETNEVGKVASLDLINENASILIDVEHCELKVVDDIDKDSLEEAQLVFDVKSALNELVDRTVADCLNEQMGSLRKRGEQLNDVKTSIKLLNDQIRDDLLIVLAELTAHLRLKIDDITDKIKGRLKDAYGVVRDAQTAIIERLNQVDNQLSYSQLNSESLDMLQAQLDSIGKELKHMSNRCHYTPPQTASMNQSALTPASVYTYSLFDDNYLYPNVDYHVDVDKIYSAIDNLSVNFFSGAMTNRSMMLMTPVDEDAETNHNRSTVMTIVSGETLEPGIVLDVIVSTGVSPDGFFWVQPARRSQNEFELLDNAHKMKRNHQRANLYIDEVCKYVRLKRIGDDSWRTYSELKRFPEVNEKCYCLEPKSRRWMRAVVINIDEVGKTCQMRLLDTGLADSTQYSLDSILPWRCDTDDLEVNEFLNYSPRAIRCVLARNSGGGEIEFERTIEQETRFLFRDLTVHTPIKCLLLKQVDLNNNVASSQQSQSEDLVWTVKLYRYQDYNQIIKFLKKEGAEVDILRHLGGEDDKTLNEVIAKSNRSEHDRMKCASQIRCQDIRVTSGQVGATSLMIKTRRDNEPSTVTAAVETQSAPTLSIEMSNKSHQDGIEKNLCHEEESNQTTITSTITLSASQQGPSDDNNSDMQPATHLVDDPTSIQDVLDQRDENRLHAARHGKCLNVYALSYDGIFWIRPQLDHKTQSLVDSLSDQIGSFIKCTQFKSFGELGVVPSVFSKCFVRETYKPRGDSSERREKWHRGFIEQSASKTSFTVRSLDLGIKIDAGKHDIYPHRKIEFYQDQTLMPKINYQAIRCFIGKMPSNTALGNYEVSKEFREKFRTYCKGTTIEFTLTEQAEVTRPEWPFKAKAWLVMLKTGKINNLFAYMSSDFLKTGQERFLFVPSSEIKMSENKPSDNRNNNRNKSKNEPLHMNMLNAPLAKSGLNMASLPPRLVSEYHGEPLLPPPQIAMSTVHFPSSQMPSSSKQHKSVSMHEKISALVSQAVNSNFNSSSASSWLSSRFDRNDIAPQQPQHNKRSELFSSSLGERQNRDNHHWQQHQQHLEQKENCPPITANEFFSEPIWEGSQSIETNSQSQAEPIETQQQQNQVAPQTDGLVDVAKNFLEHELIQPSLPEKSSHNTYESETKNKDAYTWRKGDQNRDRDRGRGFDRDRDRNSLTQHNQPQQQQHRSASTHVVHNRPSHREVCHRYQQHQHQLPNLMTQQTAAMPFTNAPIQAISHHPQQQRSPYSTAIPSYFQQRTNSGSTSVASSPGGAAVSDSDKKRDERSDKKWRSGGKPGGCRPYNDGGDMDRSDGHGGGGNGGSGPRGPGGSGRSSGFYGGSSGASNEPGNRDNKRGTRRYDGGKRHGTIGLDDDIFGGGSTVRSTVTTTRVKTTTSYLEIYEGRVEEFDIGTATAAAAAAFEDDFEGEEGDEEEAGSSIYNDDVFIEDGDDEDEAEEDDDGPFYLERDLMLTANRRHRHSSLNEKTADMIAAASELRHNVLVVNENDDEVERKRSSEHQQLRSKESAASGSTSNQGSLGLGYSISSPMANNLIVEGEDEANKTSINSFALIMDTSQPDNQHQQQQKARVAEESGTEGKGRRLWSPPSNVVKERGGRQRRHRRRNRPTTCVTSASSAELAGGKTRSFSADYALMRRDSAINLVSSTTSSSTSSSTTSTSSSSLSSISKLKKMNAELYKDKEDDLGCEDEEESYLSCTDELNNNNTNRVANRTTNTNTNLLTENTTTTTNLSTKTTSDDQLIIDHKIDEFKYERRTNSSFDHLKVHTAAITNASSSLQSTTNRTEPNCYGYSTSLAASEKAARLRLERLEKMKKLTMAIFVESFEDNSSSSSSSDSSSASTIDGNSPNSLREFEANEARINRGSIIVQDEEEDPFLFTSNPNNYANLVIDAEGNVTRGAAAIDVVSAKPPAPPGHQPNGGLQFNQRAPTSSSINNLLSPGGTDDTFETCYQSPTSNRHFAYDSDALTVDGRGRVDGSGDATDASMSSTRRKIEFFNRRANNEPDVKLISPPLRKRSSSSDAALPLPPPPPPQLMADIDALEPVAITDKLFEKFCIIENEEIMAVGGDGGDDDDNSESTLANNSKRSSNRAGAGNDLPDGASKFVPNNANQFKIRSKILNDFLEAHANDQMSLTDPLSQQHNQNKIGDKQQQIEEGDQTANIQLSFSESQADSIDQIKKQLRYMSECGIGLGMYGPRPTTGRLQSTGGDANSTILNNRSTIDISSYTSDSLFNSNFIVTPLCSDAVSPSTAQNFAIKSPLLHPNLRSQSQSQNSPNSFSVKSPCFSIPPPAPPLPKFFTARAVPVSIAAINFQETGKQQLENCDEEKSISVSSSLPPPPPPHQVADLNPRIEDLSSEDTDKMNKGVIGGGEASETTVSTSTGAGVSSSSYSLPPPPPPQLNIPVAPPLPPNGLFATAPSLSTSTTHGSSRRSTSLNSTAQSETSSRAQVTHGPQSRIKALTAQLNLAECLSAGQPIAHRSRITESVVNNENKVNTTVNAASDQTSVSNIQRSSPYRYGNHTVANFANNVKPSVVTTSEKKPLKRTVASQTDIDNEKMKSGEKGKKPARKRPSVADKIRDGEQQAAANKRHEAANFNLYGLDTETDEQSLRAMGGKLPSPPPEFRSSVPPPQSVSSSTSLATTVVPANRIGANGLNMTHDKIKNWNSLQPIPSHIQTCNDDLEQVQSTIEELERRKNQETNTNKDTNQEEESIRANRVQPFSSCPNLVQEPRSSPSAPPSGRRPPPPPLGEDENEELPTRAQTTFKLDHLANINPRRLYPNTKFRARIHDVIDERGRFHLEVMYARDDERKFAQIFKLFRLACKISPPPTDPSDLREGMRIGVFYKDDWHRAVVVEAAADSNHRASSHPRVKFLDLGIERRVDAQSNMRVVDEKFFNVPRKALRCSLYVDENVNEVVLASGHGIFRNEPLKLSSDARKFFVRVIYKKVLFAKVIEFTQDPQSNEPICKIRLGCQTHRGIIDVYLYLLSKFDRKRYELIKYIMPSPHQSTAMNRLANNPVTPSSSTSTAATTTTAHSDSDSTAPTYTLPSPPHSIVHESFEAHVGGAAGEALNSINSGGLQQQVDDEYDPDVLFSDLVGYFDRMKQAANGILNQVDEGNQYDRNNNHQESEDCQSYEDDYEEEGRECRGGLDMTPVKEQRRRQDQNDEDYDSDRTAEAAYNYDGSLYIESIHLPSITEPQQQLACAAQEEPAANISIRSAQQQPSHHHRYMRSHEVYKMSIPMPPSNPLSPPRLPRQRTHLPATNYNSDTDSSLMHATCCQMPFKAKKTKNTSTKASPRTENHQRLFEEINNLANHGALNANNGKKVKFLS